ncbi:flagellar protein FliT [Heyndrickxia sp. FSL K6-6286]|uniref:flagellar protein FliT n=1 Tax=Heyndrickxia sp. FSL K6-6286 TaxID=2921510 RepID=UPI00217D278C|nr:flagellar protein FliT [Heyndrickxia oleronia]
MNGLQISYKLTKELISYLENNSDGNRDSIIEKVAEYLDRREKAISIVSPPYSIEDELLVRELVQINKELNILLEQIKKEIQKSINGLSRKKVSINRYINPYEMRQDEGFFYDKKK